ncbi:hypothetical protein TEA_022644 [Camellia sinensis var. sinensis]|uniref:Exonuclease domain-containing protein n=1 Tax=Camellia sinensis var. sinensis TaxID=542762 RepID=A0A4S4DN76_CAMSN|nr:hypothetical protein TEA_022644 [Camellia sinensis var. sinensis]
MLDTPKHHLNDMGNCMLVVDLFRNQPTTTQLHATSGYDIQSGVHDPFVDCVSAMRLYKRMRAQDHHVVEAGLGTSFAAQHVQNSSTNVFDSWKSKELESMTPDELFQISKPNYKCWCLDSRQELHV